MCCLSLEKRSLGKDSGLPPKALELLAYRSTGGCSDYCLMLLLEWLLVTNFPEFYPVKVDLVFLVFSDNYGSLSPILS